MRTAMGREAEASRHRMAVLSAALMVGAALACTGGSAMGADAVLQDVPYLGMDWQTYLDGPQDFSLPSAMRSVMQYLGEPEERDYRYYLAVSGQAYQQLWQPETCRAGFDNPWLTAADPVHPVRRMFAAAGYAYEIVGIPEACEEMEMPVDALTEQVDAEGLRAAVCASIDAGKPVILTGRMAGNVIAGYEGGGDVLVGWRFVFDEPDVEHDEHGYVRMADWLDRGCAAIIVGEKGEAPPIRETFRDALLWAVNAARTPRVGEWVGGLETLDVWAQALTPDPELDPEDADALEAVFRAHDDSAMTLAEGRAYGGEVLRRVAELKPDAAEDLLEAARCHGLIHDLMWRIWQTPEGSWPGNASRQRFADLEVRRELRRIVLTVRDLDTKAVNHIAKALPAMGVDAGDIAPPLDWEADVLARLAERNATSGANPAAREPVHVGVSAAGVPRLAFGQGRDCTFVGALEAALAPTAHEYPYEQLMGYSGLAFRTRWFHNPEGAQTPWGDGRWHPISPHGEGPEEIAAIARATGWRLRIEDVPEATRALGRERLATDAVLSLARPLPVVVGLNTDMACVWGYHIHAVDLKVRDYQRPDEEDLLVTAYDEGLHSPFVFLDGYGEPLPEREAFLAGLTIATRNGWRVPSDGFRYGLAALDAWREDLGEYEACDDAERELLQSVNWWTLMHLLDARRAAVEFLALNADLVQAAARPALDRAIARYQDEVALLEPFLEANRHLVPWWGAFEGGTWPAETRRAQADLLAQARSLEEEALEALEEVLATEGQAAGWQLEGVEWQGRHVNHLGAVKTCLDHLGADITRGWLFGGTAHAFIINLRDVDVSGPTAWNTEMLFDLAPNLGYRVEGIKVARERAGETFGDRQREAWNLVRSSIDAGRPCYGFELQHPDFYVIYGYDEDGYLFDGWAEGRRPWRELGTYDLAVLEVYSARPCEPAPDDQVVREALTAAIRFAEDPGDWVIPGYVSGPEAFDLWAEELAAGRVLYDSNAYNAIFWHECREAAVEFLEEAKQRLPGRCDGEFDQAIARYTVVRDRLAALVEMHPERDQRDWQMELQSPEGAALMREAAAAEREGLACLKRIVAAL